MRTPEQWDEAVRIDAKSETVRKTAAELRRRLERSGRALPVAGDLLEGTPHAPATEPPPPPEQGRLW